MTQGDLSAILEAGDVKACLAYFEHATEDERKSVAPQALSWYAKQHANFFIEENPNTHRINPLLNAAEIAVLAACSLSQIKKRGLNFKLDEASLRVFESRKPPWLTELAAWSLEQNHWIWPSVRALERAGLCGRPDTDHYVLGMIVHGPPRHGPPVREALLNDPELIEREVWKLFEVEGSGELSLAARDKYCRAELSWETGLLALEAEGVLPRDRLLDASLDALERDFAQFRAGWYSRFHEALKPTLDEREKRVERYLHLLASKIPPTVSLALAALGKLDREKRLSAETLVERIGPALTARSKGAAISALKLLDSAAGREPRLKTDISKTATQALAHESPDVQSAAVDLIVDCGDRNDDALVSMLRDQVDRLAASIQPRVREWLELSGSGKGLVIASPVATEGEFEGLLARAAAIAPRFRKLAGIDAVVEAIGAGRLDVPALTFDGTEIPRLDPRFKIVPIHELEELIDVFAKVLENPEAIDDVERVLDGVSRLCDRRPAGFETFTKPLRKRALGLLERQSGEYSFGPFSGWDPALDLEGLALSWIDRELLDPEARPRFDKPAFKGMFELHDYGRKIGKWGGTSRVPSQRSEMYFLSQRSLAVARRAARGDAGPLLSSPTHREGWIDPLVLVERIGKRKREADLHDQVLALLRLAPDHRANARRKLAGVEGEFARAFHYALGGDIDTIGPTPALWVAAARARTPYGDDRGLLERHGAIGPDAGEAARYEYLVKIKPTGAGGTYAQFNLGRQPDVPAEVSSALPTVLLHSRGGEFTAALFRWGATIWPIARESWMAKGAQAIAVNLDWVEADWNNRIYLESLTDADVPLKPMALLLLTLGLAAKQADEYGLATDALIAAIDDGRLDGPTLGGSMRPLILSGLIKAPRWAKTLREAARISPLHARTIAHAIQHALAAGLTEPPRDLLTLLEVLKELLIEIGEPVSPPDLRIWLTDWKTSGKTAKLVRDLLALTRNDESDQCRAALLRALAQRVERAERWQRNADGDKPH